MDAVVKMKGPTSDAYIRGHQSVCGIPDMLILGYFSGELTSAHQFKVRGDYIEGGSDVNGRKAAIAGPSARGAAPPSLFDPYRTSLWRLDPPVREISQRFFTLVRQSAEPLLSRGLM
jgi:hypothetical protein